MAIRAASFSVWPCYLRRAEEPNGDKPAPEKEKILSATKGFPVAESISALPFAPMGEVIANAPPEPDWLWTGYVAPGALSLIAGGRRSASQRSCSV